MKNTLEIQEVTPGVIKSSFSFIDGSSMWELNQKGLTDADVLVKILQKNYYQHKLGSWVVTFPREHRAFEDQEFAKVVQLALRYIYERNNPTEHDYFC